MPDANAQTLILERDLKNLGDRISDNVHRLDRLLEIYSPTTSIVSVTSGYTSSALTLGTWNHVVGRRRASDYYPVITLNNSHTVGTSGSGAEFTANNNNAFVNRRYNSSYSSSQRYATGYWSEMRIRASDPGDNWITTEYNNQSDEAGFWGTWSDVGGATDTTNFFLMM